MKKLLVSSVIFASTLASAFSMNISFTGIQERVLEFDADRPTGLNKIYVAYNTDDIQSMVVGGTEGQVNVMRYSNLGGGFAEPVEFNYEGPAVIIDRPEGDMGYIISDSKSTTYIWLVNYYPHALKIDSVISSAEQDCDNTRLEINGEGGAIIYYTIDGRPIELSREINVSYDNLSWDDESESFTQSGFNKILDHLSQIVVLTPPLYCNSIVRISGDRFLSSWGKGIAVNSPIIYANGLDAHTEAIQLNKDDDEESSSNIIKSDIQGIGGSAPVDVEFKAYTTDAVIHNEWQIASDEMFDHIDYRFNSQNLDYTFNDEGTYYVRFIGSNNDGTCEVYGEVYTVGVGASELRIPNAFTPNGDGINDVWKVAYRSLTSFKCTIFDRYGNQLFQFDDPSEGWDGKYKGKVVKPGVYFYVIEAQGADGKKYKKGGDINIIQSKRYNNQPETAQ